MKYITLTSVASLLAASFSCCLAEENQIPTGTISVDRDKVRAGESADLSWDIDFPIDLTEIVTPDLEIKMQTEVHAFMIGTAVSNHRTKTYTYVDIGAGWQSLYSGYGSGYQYVYLGRNSSGRRVYAHDTPLNPNVSVHDHVAPVGTNLNFAARTSSGNWVYMGDQRVLTMYRGETPSSKEGWGGDASLEDYIAPYLVNGVLNIGEHDIMIAAELTHSWANRNQSGYDSNDSIALFRFIPVEE